ncbi:cation diffusion facilitator family transporter [Halobaculum sp. WSA2]|uniref:Cation diffusion facilitator family transporter n=1 Tax=Halobaculum saliterrae TaxID=2073113 RepID=A0A6B0SVP0_9EURY|nr:cation diffusion facilitator family transporter [Halobaculum saliterrae]MXR43098.1 cation diffusion facilitator family transporter [Halobaculum saliterrae]
MAHTHDEDATHSDSERVTTSRSSRRLAFVAVINLVGFVVELAGGLLFGSVALISDAIHMLFDMLAYAMAFAASYTAERFDGGEDWSYGLHRLEPVAAFLNGVLLLPMVGYILWESYQRFLEPVAINPELTLIIATGGLLVNVGSVYVLQGDEMSLNERGAFYHLLGDAGGSVAVIVSTVAVAVFDLPVADPAAAVLIGILVLASAGNVLRESTSILLERSPVSPEELRAELTTLDGVDQIEDLHVWQVCSQLIVATVQLTDTGTTLEEQRAIRSRVHDHLADQGIDHATVELVGHGDPNGTTKHAH